jgi:glycosyltransferase involved in cell wall biosynthesis
MSDSRQPARPTLSVVIATAFREATLRNTLRSLAVQRRRPDEVVIVDGAPESGVEALVAAERQALDLNLVYMRSTRPSAAVQRNLGLSASSGDVIVFLDDDAYPEPDCFAKIVAVLDQDREARIGGVGILIRNQLCVPPSAAAKRWFDFLADEPRGSYSGMVIGPAVAIGPEPTTDGAIVSVEWLMAGCAAFRREALPPGGFNPQFWGYSYMEDVDLSVRVARRFSLVVHTGAFMFHDTQPSRFKAPYVRAKMVVQNRYYVMTETLGRVSISHHTRFVASLIVPQLTSLRAVRSGRDLFDWLKSSTGIVSGLLVTSAGAFRRVVFASEARVGF